MTTIAKGTAPRDLPQKFAWLLRRLKAYHVLGWDYDSDGPTWPAIDREAAFTTEADVISSELDGALTTDKPHHIVAIDIDYPAYLVESSTEGHYHLYLDVPGGVPHEKYLRLLDVLADAGVIQEGYATVSKQRGHSDLRLPWVPKQPYPGSDAPIVQQPAPSPVDF